MNAIFNLICWAMNVPEKFRPMRREDADGELSITREEPHEDEREYGSPVG